MTRKFFVWPGALAVALLAIMTGTGRQAPVPSGEPTRVRLHDQTADGMTPIQMHSMADESTIGLQRRLNLPADTDLGMPSISSGSLQGIGVAPRAPIHPGLQDQMGDGMTERRRGLLEGIEEGTDSLTGWGWLADDVNALTAPATGMERMMPLSQPSESRTAPARTETRPASAFGSGGTSADDTFYFHRRQEERFQRGW